LDIDSARPSPRRGWRKLRHLPGGFSISIFEFQCRFAISDRGVRQPRDDEPCEIRLEIGYILEPKELLEETAPAIAERMRAENVDAAALVPA
jgi:hypothetical protein